MPRHCRRDVSTSAFTLVELLIVIGIFVLVVSILLPALSRARQSSIAVKLAAQERDLQYQRHANTNPQAFAGDNTGQPAATPRPQPRFASVTSFSAKVDLTPRLSVGTAQPESIYEARFTARLQAHAPEPSASDDPRSTCELHLPLPPQIISLADLSISINKTFSDTLTLRDSSLVWTGHLPTTPTPIEITYSAVGKGLYVLQTPPGKILETFDLQLTANGSDVRMLELSLQPTNSGRAAGQTTYTWNYKRLLFGRPIQLDVLGIAPIDRLGEIRWLGPLSVIAFGILVGLYAHAHQLVKFDRWMLLLVLGAFTGAYPLMYFAQEFVRLPLAVSLSAGLVFGIIAGRSFVVIGFWHTIRGVLLPAAASMSIALVAATQPQLQGILLTGSAILFFLLAMTLLPRVNFAAAAPAHNPSPLPKPA